MLSTYSTRLFNILVLVILVIFKTLSNSASIQIISVFFLLIALSLDTDLFCLIILYVLLFFECQALCTNNCESEVNSISVLK